LSIVTTCAIAPLCAAERDEVLDVEPGHDDLHTALLREQAVEVPVLPMPLPGLVSLGGRSAQAGQQQTVEQADQEISHLGSSAAGAAIRRPDGR
jgi:hypothetical protein